MQIVTEKKTEKSFFKETWRNLLVVGKQVIYVFLGEEDSKA